MKMEKSEVKLTREMAVHFRGILRSARNRVLADSEATFEILTALDTVGSFVANDPSAQGFAAYADSLERLASGSALYDRSFRSKFDQLRSDRNDHMHLGAAARRTALSAVSVSLVLEDAMAIKAELRTVDDLMTEHPVCAETWQTLKIVRQLMLVHQFSFLPVKVDQKWRVLADYSLARFIRSRAKSEVSTLTLGAALQAGNGALELLPSVTVDTGTPVEEAFARDHHLPRLVTSREGDLIGILTGFDLL